MKLLLVLPGSILLLLIAVALVGSLRWRARTGALAEQLLAGPSPAGADRVTLAEVDGLPPPVARYLRAVLREGQPRFRSAHFEQRGTFLLSPPDGWQPFTATHDLVAGPPGFLWSAAIRLAPGLRADVRDAFIAGAGSMRGSIFGVIPLVTSEGTPEIARAALQRYLAEAVWCPTALLPSAGVRWHAASDTVAVASLAAGAIEVAVEFRFGADSLVESIHVPDRARAVGKALVPTPWEGRWFRYEERGGMRIPIEGEVGWLLPTGPQLYWRGRVLSAEFSGGRR